MAVDEADVTRIVGLRLIAIGEAGPDALVPMAVQLVDVLRTDRKRSRALTVVPAHGFRNLSPSARDR